MTYTPEWPSEVILDRRAKGLFQFQRGTWGEPTAPDGNLEDLQKRVRAVYAERKEEEEG